MNVERHNELTREWVMKIAKEASSIGELMVLVESVLVATMLINVKRYGAAPSTSVELVQDCLHQAVERFTKAMNK